MSDTVNKNSARIKDFLIRTLADPVLLYTVLVMMAIMYHYRNTASNVPKYGSTVIYGAVTYIIGWFVFRFMDYMNRKSPDSKRSFLRSAGHGLISFVGYIVLLYVFMRIFGVFVDIGSENYPISWGLWFLTPQDSLEFNAWFARAIFVLFLIFMLSVIYYFTRVRYRIFMNFLIFIIPFTIYGKEYEKMPIGFIIALAVGYVLMMINFRQLRENEKTSVVDKPQTWGAAGAFMVLFALVSSLIPKPEIEADRTVLEMLINADTLTDRLVEMLNVFRDTADGEQFRGQTSNTPLYYAEASEPLRLKTSTFSYYDFKNDSWSVSDIDTYYKTNEETPVEIWFSGGVAEALLLAAEMDGDFAAKYGLSDYADVTLEKPAERTMRIFSSVSRGESVPVPQGASSLTRTSYSRPLALTRAAAIMTIDNDRYGNENFSFTYAPDGFFSMGQNKRIVDMLAEASDYSAMLSDAYDVLVYYSGLAEYGGGYSDELAEELANSRQVMNVNASFYDSYLTDLMDYGGDQQIYELAQQLTAGLDSEYEKAKALEWYFIQNGYTYDLDYVKASGENVHDFLFETKTGVCYEYATAMTLLARAAGIPARYCEGYNMQQEYSNNNWSGYMVSARDAHGFPELYIKGYGWLTFEPTMTNASAAERETKNTTTSLLSRAGLILLAAAAVMLLFILVSPLLSHKLFTLRNRRRQPDKAVLCVIRRIYKLYGISSAHTVKEAEEIVRSTSGADISHTAGLFDMSVYGGAALSENDRTRAMEDYSAAYEALKETKKKSRRRKK